MQEAAVGPALKINFDLRKDARKIHGERRDAAFAGEHKSG
jgi:hypothetical protein